MVGDDARDGTFGEGGYDRSDWLPIIKALDDQEELVPQGRTTEGYIDYLMSEENKTGEELMYTFEDPSYGLWIEYSPSLRKKTGQMIWGTIEFYGDFKNEHVANAHEKILKSHATAYTMPPGGYEESLATISIPEEFNEDELYATLQASVDMIKDAKNLQEELKTTAENYEPTG